MREHPNARRAIRWMAGGTAFGAGCYAGLAALTWWRYGRPAPTPRHEADALLDRFIPSYEVVERHRTFVRAPAAVTLQAAKDQDLLGHWLVRAIFDARGFVLGSEPDDSRAPRQLLPRMQSIGWRVLAEVDGREVVVGAVTRPWEANVVFRPIPPEAFAAFAEPGYVKIVWSLRADPISDHQSIFRTETRAIATDSAAAARFRRYWAFASPGIALIRRLSLGPVKRAAERMAYC